MKSAALILSILTLNVAGPRRVHQGWQSRREALSARLKNENADVAAFQEIWRRDDAAALAAASGHQHLAHEPALGLAVTSRRPIVDRDALDLGDGYGILRAGIDLGGATADVYSARLEPETNPSALRLGQLLAASEFIRTRSKTRAFVLLGDLAIASGDKEAEIFQDLTGTRDLCISHGDEMCGRTLEDRRVDYILLPYSPHPPREEARTAFTTAMDDDGDNRPLSTHFGLAARLDGAWLKLRLSPEPEGRLEALSIIADRLDAARLEAVARAKFAGFLPWLGSGRTLRARAEAARLAADYERATTALARAAKPIRSLYE